MDHICVAEVTAHLVADACLVKLDTVNIAKGM